MTWRGTVLVLNNYPLRALAEAVTRREAPSQLLFGVDCFERAGWRVEYIEPEGRPLLRRVSEWLLTSRCPVPFGDLAQQVEALARLNACDLIYAASQTQTQVLHYLRAIGLVRRPIVTVVHHPMNRGRLAWFRQPLLDLQLRGTDTLATLSGRLAEEINVRNPGKAVHLPWGPDAAFYTPSPDIGSGAIASGRTGRDFATFGRGASKSGTAATIVCLDEHVTPVFASFSDNVRVLAQPVKGWMSYPQLMQHYARARVLAIPHFGQTSIVGLSSLVDALGMGKPVIMTRHPLLDIDVEAAGIGRWVDAGDVEGWRAALAWFDQHPAEAAAMGHRARALVDRGLNAETFGQGVLRLFDDALRRQ